MCPLTDYQMIMLYIINAVIMVGCGFKLPLKFLKEKVYDVLYVCTTSMERCG